MWSASKNNIPKEQIQKAHIETLKQGVYDIQNCEDFDPETLTEPMEWLEANTPHAYKIGLFREALKCGNRLVESMQGILDTQQPRE